MEPPAIIHGFDVVEYGFFPQPMLPIGYVAPTNGQLPSQPIQNLAICVAEEIDGYYLLFCTREWRYVTYSFNETLEFIKRSPLAEFGHDIAEWHKAHRIKSSD